MGGSDHGKHIALREQFADEAQRNDILRLDPIKNVDDVAGLLTKPLIRHPFIILRKHLMGLQILQGYEPCCSHSTQECRHYPRMPAWDVCEKTV